MTTHRTLRRNGVAPTPSWAVTYGPPGQPFGTSRKDGYGNRLPGEYNEHGLPLGSGDGVHPVGARGLTPDANWNATFKGAEPQQGPMPNGDTAEASRVGGTSESGWRKNFPTRTGATGGTEVQMPSRSGPRWVQTTNGTAPLTDRAASISSRVLDRDSPFVTTTRDEATAIAKKYGDKTGGTVTAAAPAWVGDPKKQVPQPVAGMGDAKVADNAVNTPPQGAGDMSAKMMGGISSAPKPAGPPIPFNASSFSPAGTSPIVRGAPGRTGSEDLANVRNSLSEADWTGTDFDPLQREGRTVATNDVPNEADGYLPFGPDGSQHLTGVNPDSTVARGIAQMMDRANRDVGNYAKGLNFPGVRNAMQREKRAIAHHVGGAHKGDKPEAVRFPGVGPMVINSGEKVIPTPNGQPAVLNRSMQKHARTAFGDLTKPLKRAMATQPRRADHVQKSRWT